MAKKYKLKKNLPTFKAGDIFYVGNLGGLVHQDTDTVAYTKETLDKFPDAIKDWFEEIPDRPKTVWDLKDGDVYYCISNTRGEVYCPIWIDHIVDKARRAGGNCFLTEEEAMREKERLKAKATLEQDTKGFKRDIRNPHQEAYRVHYDYVTKKLDWECEASFMTSGNIYFVNVDDLKASIENHRQEWLTYLGVEEDNGTK